MRARSAAVLVVASMLLLAGCSLTGGSSDAVTLTCPGTVRVGRHNPWYSALALDGLGRSADAEDEAVRALRRTGGLPHNASQCSEAKALLTPATKTVGDYFGGWLAKWGWAVLAVLLFVLVMVAGWVVRRPTWRKRGWPPGVRLAIADADDSATGVTVGAQLAARVRTQLTVLDRDDARLHLNLVGASDAQVDLPPLDQVPERVQWIVALYQWLAKRNDLKLTTVLAPGQRDSVGVIAEVQEPTGKPTRISESSERRELILRSRGGSPTGLAAYLDLASPVMAWSLFQIKEIRGEDADLDQLIGTQKWEAYARMLEGVAAFDAGRLSQAREHFREARRIDDSDMFWELRLNDAYALARSDERDDWTRALSDFVRLIGELS